VSPASIAEAVRGFLLKPRDARRWARAWGISLGAWLSFDLLAQIQWYSYYREKGLDVPAGRFLADYWDSLVWAFFSPFVLLLIFVLPISRRTWRRALPVHLAAAVAAGLVWIPNLQGVRLVLVAYFDDAGLSRELSSAFVFRILVQSLMLYTEIAAVGHGIHYYRESQARALKTSRLEAQLAQAQLQVLRMQLHPHFLFNTLNTISALVHKDARAADRMLALLGDLLRDSFDKLGAQEVELKEEIDFLDRYLEIEKTRFQDRLVVAKDLDPEALDALVPYLILQPLVENAIRHGVARRAGAGRIELLARRENGELRLHVRDDGPGMTPGAERAAQGGVGLANSQARLQQLYGSSQRLELVARPEGGLDVSLTIPFRSASPPA
jgi:signal transduction histidine kinase